MESVRGDVILLMFLFVSKFYFVKPAYMQYCDGKKLITLHREDCVGGINFGNHPPSCMCIRGLYRTLLPNCQSSIGFSDGKCIEPIDADFTYINKGNDSRTTGALSHHEIGIQFLTDLEEIRGTTSVIVQDYEDKWHRFAEGSDGSVRAKSFFVFNGFVLTYHNKSSFCIERHVDNGDFGCGFTLENTIDKGLASGENIHIKVTDNCEKNIYTEYLPRNISIGCDFVLTEGDCYLDCKKPASEISEEIETFADFKEEKYLIYDKSGSTLNIEDKRSQSSSEGKKKSENRFLNRKLNHWAKLREVGLLEKPKIGQVKPSKTFKLLEISKNITQKICQASFTSKIFLDQAFDLFLILYQGRGYRYSEDLDTYNYEWIKSILLKCYKNSAAYAPVIKLTEWDQSCPESKTFYHKCYNEDEDERCEAHESNSHSMFKNHVVIDTIWNIIDFIQAACFKYFDESYLMFHIWEQAAETLFTREIRKLWYESLNIKIYQNILTAYAFTDMYHLEQCVEAAYINLRVDKNPMLPRLLMLPEVRDSFRRRKRFADSRKHPEDEKKRPTIQCRRSYDDFNGYCSG